MKNSKRYRRAGKIGLTLISVLIIIFYFGFAYPFWGTFFNKQRHGNPLLTPPWALECWLWEDDYNTAEYVDTLLAGYAKYDIPVRTILLDSPWSLRYNDFEVDTVLYPNPKEWFGRLQDEGYRVVLWMTTMVNSYSKDTRIKESEDWFKEAAEKGYLTGNGDQIKWWKGKGGFIDYTNPEAMKWWRRLQQTVFDYGIDGWKLDGTATLNFKRLGPVPVFYQSTKKGIMSTRTYMDLYYRDEYVHGLTQNPDFITLSRAIDRGYHPEGFAPIDATPVTWVGDQRHSWNSESDGSDTVDVAMDGIEGIEMAMENIIKSAKVGYNIIGSDVAGFSGSKIPPRLYIRWAQFSTFCGLFLNGGHGERALWKRSPQELEIIRKFSWLHTELIPYMYSYVVEAHSGGTILQRPVKGKYHYLFGNHFLVAPIYKDGLVNEVNLPKGKWRYFFDDSEFIEGPVTFDKEFPLEEFPVYIREGAIIPMDIKRDYTKIGDESFDGFLTYLIYPEGESSFTVHHPDLSGSTTVQVSYSEEKINITLNGVQKPHILKIHLDKIPRKIELDGRQLFERVNYSFNESTKKLVIRTQEYSTGNYTINKNADPFYDFRKPKNGIYVIAHRGAHQGIPENSLPAYQKAIDLGCDFVEIDVRTTRDGQFVSIHNSTIDSYVTGKTGSVRNMTLAELKALDIGERLGEEWKNTRIPTFEEILQLCQGKIGIYLDLKDAPIPELMELIRKYNMENDIVWYIPYQNLMQIENVDQLFGDSYPMPNPQSEQNIKTALKNIKTPLIATDMGELSLSFVDEAHKYGARIFVDEKEGTVAEWRKIIGWGTEGIQSDKPADLIEYLKQNK